ncbi:diacylglycerol kinase [Bowmanella denitrificans]|uniref:Diacylglycerol kinase n=1 Tax=Bowmanella denitrificans TaxID=366582 RepID=A0ABP3HKP1_9ALTE
MDGIGYAFRHEAAFRQELMLCVVMIPLAFWLANTPVELVLLTGPLILLLVVECINSAIEAAIDRISTDRHPLSKQAKDLGSAAVFFSMLIILMSWLAIALPKAF